MLNYNLCYDIRCKNKVEYLAKDGVGYCSKHTLELIDVYGMNLFWPHYHTHILKDISFKLKQDKNKSEQIAKDILDSLGKDVKYTKIPRKK